MANTRNAGRKPKMSADQLNAVKNRLKNGESVASLAAEYGISRQALYKNLQKERLSPETQIDYMIDDRLCTRIFIDRRSQALRIVNYSILLSERAFGTIQSPALEDLQDFLDRFFLENNGADEPGIYYLTDKRGEIEILSSIPEGRANNKNILIKNSSQKQEIPQFFFSKKDRVLRRTDTDGFQMKAVTDDRRYFIKSQAVIAGVRLRDWAVEIIASDLCDQLSIPCVKQRHARFVYEGNAYDGVFSPNFELDGYTFISFQRLMDRNGWSTREEEFIALDAIAKLKWCAKKLAEAGNLNFADTEKYMMDLALIDCLVGNTDRHDHNYGLFYNVNSQQFEIPLIFDCGMGLFENDYYRDKYLTFDEAMHNVYIAPYGEDPFDLLKALDREYGLKKTWPAIDDFAWPDILHTPFALEYERRISSLCQKSDGSET